MRIFTRVALYGGPIAVVGVTAVLAVSTTSAQVICDPATLQLSASCDAAVLDPSDPGGSGPGAEGESSDLVVGPPKIEVETSKPGTPAKIKNPTVAGGDVEVRTGVEGKIIADNDGVKVDKPESFKDGFSIGYQGKSADECTWLQFSWHELEVIDPKPFKGKSPYRAPGEISTSSADGKLQLTTDPSNPNYQLDTGSKDRVDYESAGHDNRTDTETTIFDTYGGFDGSLADGRIVFGLFADGAKKVASRAHWVTYLTCNDGKGKVNVVYRVHLTAEFILTKFADDVTPTVTVEGDRYDKLDQGARDRLKVNYPGSDTLIN